MGRITEIFHYLNSSPKNVRYFHFRPTKEDEEAKKEYLRQRDQKRRKKTMKEIFTQIEGKSSGVFAEDRWQMKSKTGDITRPRWHCSECGDIEYCDHHLRAEFPPDAARKTLMKRHGDICDGEPKYQAGIIVSERRTKNASTK